jgi:hypothetical protein
LVCQSSVCLCNTEITFYNGSTCQLKSGHNESCTQSVHCLAPLKCDLNNKCLCERQSNGNLPFYMASNNTCIPCPSSWFSSDRICVGTSCQNRNFPMNFCYINTVISTNWDNAHSHCLNISAHLGQIRSVNDFTFLRNFVSTAGYTIWVSYSKV